MEYQWLTRGVEAKRPGVWAEVRREARYMESTHADVGSGEAMFIRARAAGFTRSLKLPSKDSSDEIWLFRTHADIAAVEERDTKSAVRLCEMVLRGYREAIPVPPELRRASEREVRKSPESGSTGARDLEYFVVDIMQKMRGGPLDRDPRSSLWHQIIVLYLLDLGRLQREHAGRNPEFAQMNGQQTADLVVEHWHLGDRGFIEYVIAMLDQKTLDIPPRNGDSMDAQGGTMRHAGAFTTRLHALERRLKL